MQIGDALAKAYTPAGCEEAEVYRASAAALADYAAKMLEDRIGNLEWTLKRVPFTNHQDKEDIRETITGLRREHAEFFKGDKGKGWCR